jgi:hypothetical protein
MASSLYASTIGGQSTLLNGVYNGQGAGISGGMPVVTSNFASATGVTQQIARFYLDGSSTWANWTDVLGYWTGTTKVRLNISVPFPSSEVSGAGGISPFLVAGAAGDYNTYYASLASALIADGWGNAILNIAIEWDVGLIPSTTTDYANWAAMWNQIVPAMKAVSGANFHFAWYCGGYDYYIYTGPTEWANCLPNAANVDSVNIDLYDQQYSTPPGTWPPVGQAGWNSTQSTWIWTNQIEPVLTWVAARAAGLGKPVSIGEWGIWTVGTEGAPACNGTFGGDDPYFMAFFVNWMKANNVVWNCYFNSNPNLIDPSDWAPLSAAQYSALL